MKTIYCCGFLFCATDNGQPDILLIRKNRPSFLRGLLNGIGGHVEPGETPLDAMRREFNEEAGLTIDGWMADSILNGPDFVVHFFHAWADRETFLRAQPMTDEPIVPVNLALLSEHKVVSNFPVLVSIALDRSGIAKPVQLFDGIAQEARSSDMTAGAPAA
jgi:8-oxo-dGTP diphosphatase